MKEKRIINFEKEHLSWVWKNRIWTFRGKWERHSRRKGGSQHVAFMNGEATCEWGPLAGTVTRGCSPTVNIPESTTKESYQMQREIGSHVLFEQKKMIRTALCWGDGVSN